VTLSYSANYVVSDSFSHMSGTRRQLTVGVDADVMVVLECCNLHEMERRYCTSQSYYGVRDIPRRVSVSTIRLPSHNIPTRRKEE
jgi:hypothetical protein